jgi:large conductance mechanosensitive channel
MLKEFKEFAIKGNMVDMAVGIIIGAAFGTVVKSLVDDVLMPIISGLFGAPDFSNLFIILKNPADVAGVNMESINAVREAGGVALGYGLFINALIAFLLVALALFFIIKGMNKLQRKKDAEIAAEAPAAVEPSTEEKLLAEIRDLLKSRPITG